MDFLNRIANSPQVQQALSEFLPGLHDRAKEIFGPIVSSKPNSKYGMDIITEEPVGRMPIVPAGIVDPSVIPTPPHYDYYLNEQQSKQFDFPAELEDLVREQAIRDSSYIQVVPLQ